MFPYIFHFVLKLDTYKVEPVECKDATTLGDILETGEIEERMIDENKQMGLIAQDLLKYECGEYILDYEDDVYGINDNQLLQATMGALQEEIRLRDEQIEELKQDIEDLKQCVKMLMGGE